MLIKNNNQSTELNPRRQRLQRYYKIFLGAVTAATIYGATAGILNHKYNQLHPRDIGKTIVEKFRNYDGEISGLEQTTSLRRTSDTLMIQGLEKNKHGHRTPREDYEVEKPEDIDQYRIANIGESTTLGQFVEAWEAFAYQTELGLKQRYPKINILSMNMGRGGAVARENLLDYINKHQKFGADLTVIHVGINDASTRITFGRIENETPTIEIKETPRKLETQLLNNWFIGPLIRYPYAMWMRNSNKRAMEIQERLEKAVEDGKRKTIEAEGETESLKRAKDSTEFYNYTKTLVKLVKVNGSEVILYAIPRNPYMEARNESERLTQELQRIGIEANTEALRRIAQEENVHYLETDPKAIPEEAWHAKYDECHLTAEGHRLKAEALTRLIMEKQLIPKEMARRKAEQDKTLQRIHEEAQQSRVTQKLEAIAQ